MIEVKCTVLITLQHRNHSMAQKSLSQLIAAHPFIENNILPPVAERTWLSTKHKAIRQTR
jgi:hypothetical protein